MAFKTNKDPHRNKTLPVVLAIICILTVITLATLHNIEATKRRFKSTDKSFFQSPPIILVENNQYYLKWIYGEYGFLFIPNYIIDRDKLIFSLNITTSSGNKRGKEGKIILDKLKVEKLIQKGNVFWDEGNNDLTKIRIEHGGKPNEYP
jgi:hypothetical protein